MSDTSKDKLIEKVQANRKYARINQDLVQRLVVEVVEKGLSGRTAVKAVRNKLHQVGGAYFNQNIDYSDLENALSGLPADFHADEIFQFCRESMRMHASTSERLPILEDFFRTCLEPIAPVSSILDLACGLNPLALPWMPLADDCVYHACDIYEDMLDFIRRFFDYFSLKGMVFPCDLIAHIPQKQVQVAFILKSIPCLEQMDKTIGLRLLDAVKAEHILISFPVRSLGGKQKGMLDFYAQHFSEMIANTPWKVKEFSFSTELAYLVSK